MRKLFAVLSVVVCALAVVRPAEAADGSRAEVAGGYSFLDDTTASQTLNGWFASVGGYFTDSFGVVAEVGGNYSSITVLGTSISLSEFSFMAGPKFAGRTSSGLTPFAQVLLGGVHGKGGALGITASQTEFALQPGAGVDIAIAPNAGIRVEADYRGIFSSGSTENNFRFVAGIVLHP